MSGRSARWVGVAIAALLISAPVTPARAANLAVTATANDIYFSWFDKISDPGFTSDNIHLVNPQVLAANVTVSIPGCPNQPGTVPGGGGSLTFTCAGFGGPVHIHSDQPILGSQRVKYYQSFNEVLGTPGPASSSPTTLYFPWYDRISDIGFQSDNIHIVNPTGATANVTIKIPGFPGCTLPASVPAGGSGFFGCPTGFGGPVVVTADQSIMASQRVKYYQSFNEVTAKTAVMGSTDQYFTWFDRISSVGFVGDNIHVINPNSTTTNVSISIPGVPSPCTVNNDPVPAGGQKYYTCATGFGGPIHVTSTQSVIASQRVKYFQSFNEAPAQPTSAATAAQVFSWFDRISDAGFQGDNLHVVNPNGGPVIVTVSVPGCPLDGGTIAPGSYLTFTCASGFGGPVLVTSTGGGVLTSQRVQFYLSFNEVIGQASTLFTPPPPPPPPSGFPNLTNTGVTAARCPSTLTSITTDVLLTTGQTLQNAYVHGGAAVTAAGHNITISCVRVKCEVLVNCEAAGNNMVLVKPDQAGVDNHNLIVDSEVDGGCAVNSAAGTVDTSPITCPQGQTMSGLAFSSGVGGSGFTCLRCRIRAFGHGITDDGSTGSPDAPVLVQDSYVYDLYARYSDLGSHNEAFLTNGATKGLKLIHNSFECWDGQTAAISMFGDFDPVQNVTIDGNLLNGGGFALYGGDSGGKPFSGQTMNIVVTNNHWGKKFFAQSGQFGPVTAFNQTASGNVWGAGNVWDDGSGPVNP